MIQNTFADMAISNQAKGIPIIVPWKAQRLTVEEGKPIIPTRVPDPYSLREGEDIVRTHEETVRGIG